MEGRADWEVVWAWDGVGLAVEVQARFKALAPAPPALHGPLGLAPTNLWAQI